ncbi:hypothetical protein QBW33_13285 [Streptomyces sp. B21-104]|uniref:hypothetical protein n=1 Tax=Streptomyces sp. B21-104 TaxID=3039421 RepID=UPI0030D482E9
MTTPLDRTRALLNQPPTPPVPGQLDLKEHTVTDTLDALIADYMPRLIDAFGLFADSYEDMPPAEAFERALEDAAETLDEDDVDSEDLVHEAGRVAKAGADGLTGERYRMWMRQTLDPILAARESA